MIPRFAILASALVPGLIALCSVPAWAQAEGPDRIVFLRDVYPILEDRCFKCHGEKKQKGDLRLDTRAGLFENEDTNAIPVVPGQPARSLVYKRITLPADHDERMPFSGNPLTSAQVQLIKTWIEQGAEWSQPQKAETGGPAEEDPLPREGEPSAGGDPGEASVVPKSIDFNRDVRPILSDKCFRCHGPDADQREARLRLDTKTGAFSALKGGGHAIVPGDSARSELVRRIAHGNPGERMPPPDSNLTLEPHERQILTRWIEGGAPWKEHWAFVAPKRAPLPPIGDRNWPRNAIDFFILARLEAEALTPSKPASRRTLIRRVTFDLTGLPPTPAEVRAFVAIAGHAPTSPQARRTAPRLP